MILVLDCETTGLPANYNAPLTDFDNWPRAVEIAWAVFNDNHKFVRKHSHIIYPYGFEIPADATAKHGITTVQAQTEGTLIYGVLEDLANDMHHADWVVAHNIDFDSCVLGAEFLRAGFINHFDLADMICTMRASTDFCKLPSPEGNGYKWPKLSELYATLFDGATIEGEHRAETDVLACAKCFFELVERGVIVLEKEYDEKMEMEIAESETPAAPSIFTPLELQERLIREYGEQDQTRMTLHHAEHTFWEAQRELDALNYALRQSEGYAACKNEAQRADYLYGHNQEGVQTVDITKVDALGARLDFERARDRVELTRALLRVAELAAGISRAAA